MEKNIKDYLKYYIDCEIMGVLNDEPRKGYLTGIHGEYEVEIQFFNDDGFNVSEGPEYNLYTDVKPILRKLESMTEDEVVQMFLLKGLDYGKVVTRTSVQDECFMQIEYKCAGELLSDYQDIRFMWPSQFHYLLSKGFDLFGLIDAGLAIAAPPLTIQNSNS